LVDARRYDRAPEILCMDPRNRSLLPLASLLFGGLAIAQSPALATRSYFTYGTGIGAAGFRVSAAGGATEVLVPCGAAGFGTGARYWILHRYDAVLQSYQQVFTSPVYPETDPVVRTAVGDLAAAAGPELVFATKLGTVEVWNQATRTKLHSFTAGIGELRGLCLGDANGDAAPDVIVSSASSVRAFSASGTPLWLVSTVGSDDLAIGQMDADAALEVATTSGRVIDCGTRLVQWHWQNGFGIDVECADIDGDGRDEVIAGESWNWVWSFDVDTQLPKWSLALGDIDCIALANVDADPNVEILVGEGQWGDVRVFDSVTQQQEFSINNTEHGVTGIATGDTDGDGQTEIVFGAGWTSTGPDFWYVAGVASQAIEWTSPSIASGFLGPQRGDVDGDGVPELVCLVPSLSYGGPHIMLFDEVTLALKYMSPSLPYSSTGSLSDLKLADVDGNGDMEVFVVYGSVTAFNWNGSAFAQTWQIASTYSGPSFRKVAIADLDGNGTFEIVLGGSQYAHVYAYGGATELWRSFYLGGEVRDVIVGNSDGNPGTEIHALSSDGNIYVFDGPTRDRGSRRADRRRQQRWTLRVPARRWHLRAARPAARGPGPDPLTRLDPVARHVLGRFRRAAGDPRRAGAALVHGQLRRRLRILRLDRPEPRPRRHRRAVRPVGLLSVSAGGRATLPAQPGVAPAHATGC
jgi:hypothetical protein